MSGLYDFFQFIGVLFVFGVIYGVASYILYSLPLFLFAGKLGYSYSWLAWIPFCRWFVLMKISEPDGANRLKIRSYNFNRNTCAWLTIFLPFLSILPLVGSVLSKLCLSVLIGASCRDLYARFDKKENYEVCVLGYFSGLFKVILVAKLYQYLYQIRRG